MKKIISIVLGASILFGVLAIPVLGQTTGSSGQVLIQSLKEQIERLREQIQTLVSQLEIVKQVKKEVKATTKEITTTLKLIKNLKKGMSGEDVKLLQEVLATDSEIYPEGLVTGYFGQLTEKAVKRFQKIAGIEQVGLVGPKTLAKINELLQEGAGKSGKVPPGLLIAPGIRKKLGGDITAPIISDILATASSSSAEITWLTNEKADSKIWYDTLSPIVANGSTPTISSPNLVLNHRIAIFGLVPITTYYYVVSSTDSISNTTTSSQETFTTFPE